MPDSEWLTVSASQAPALFNQSQYFTRFVLWHAFRTHDRSLIEGTVSRRMELGKLYQPVILQRAAIDYRLDIFNNAEDIYVRNGLLGCTRDGHMFTPDWGREIVEAKRTHWLIWRQKWSETMAPMDIEIQLQQQLLVEGCRHGVIACDNGDDKLLYYPREVMTEVHEQLLEESASFFDSLKTGKEPDPLGSPLELPALAKLYPKPEPAKTIENFTTGLAETIRTYEQACKDRAFHKKLEDQTKAIILARGEDAEWLVANGYRVKIKKSTVAEQVCAAHTEPKTLRKEHVRTEIEVLPGEVIAEGELEEGLRRYLDA